GLFGCFRTAGPRFPWGLDLFPLYRDGRGEARDPVYAILPGRIVHINTSAGLSSYGRYVVVMHDRHRPAFHTLYAHLASVPRDLKVGQRVAAGQVIATMGRSAAGYTIPRSRAHVHLEMGFRLTDRFAGWFDRQDFGSDNHHGAYNGMNLVSWDPLAFYEAVRDGRIGSVEQFLAGLEPACTLRVYSGGVPDFVRRYPDLVRSRDFSIDDIVAWEVTFNAYGVPFAWLPRYGAENLDGDPGDIEVLAYDRDRIEAVTCRQTLLFEGKRLRLGGTLSTILELLFGFDL
ncbi:MAG: peptidoglycan DD-metalloendopeptidase family protein, partial [Opitutales bacterium]